MTKWTEEDKKNSHRLFYLVFIFGEEEAAKKFKAWSVFAFF